MNVLLIGSGGRENALAWKMAQSKILTKLYVAPGNAGTEEYGENLNIDVNNFDELKKVVISKNVNLVVVGPEQPLVAGLHDYFLSDKELCNISVIGPQKYAAKLEGSKDFAKDFMKRHNIPTAAYNTYDKSNVEEGIEFLHTLKAPYVLKADGLAGGKGVLILDNLQEAEKSLREMLEGKFGEASSKVVIEEFLDGIELSVFVLSDGKSYKLLPDAKDYKRIGEGDTGLNTGGMGAVSPVPFADKEFLKKVEEKVINPTIKGFKKDKFNYKGFVFFGLMKVGNEPYVIEYNVRLGDPETEVIIPRMECDILEVFKLLSEGNLDKAEINISDKVVCSVMLVSGGYPKDYLKGKVITKLNKVEDSILFHAGTKKGKNKIITNGGRVIAISTISENIADALKICYKNADIIEFENKYYRKDIGFDLNYKK
ncbi:MAG: phosphoribosylamine--glycine ligase [Bacteroidales bacterium]|jgi:phosphoribosylamine--glycine ligase|nr:phosphoribosylamine--glycine ligase [Bacteroidales bacterium]